MTYRREYEVDILLRGNDPLLTTNCTRSILQNTDTSRIHITYVNNGGGVFLIDNDYRELNLYQEVRLPFNHGSVRAINIGLSLAVLSDSDFVLLLDNDVTIPDGDTTWLNRWISYFDDEKVGAAGAVASYSSGFQTPHSTPDVYQKAWQVDGEGTGYGDPPHVPILASFGLMLRKEAIEDAGLFDERYEPGQCEDFDYIFQLHDAGWKSIVANSVWVHHKGSQTFGRNEAHALEHDNMKKLVDKWGVEKLRSFGLEVDV